ncbi:acyl-CoA desaturase [Bermanella marisrubri]|uniref:Fatty-acid desaturase n=1 Tax=Bermanella marisrubri TaxID=207949 RepID=Q1MZD5_9GAMM|nr:acyl-CoA desaturase [Bermanella marisrubri]EAT11331.1 Fatty-acid desaturase [Oceanobacter sp. RED65] [Bermanella marisrubri]QIZ85282.1 acyl-CoA desaturase [Bermanella marisrubri]
MSISRSAGSLWRTIKLWVDAEQQDAPLKDGAESREMNWLRVMPFIFIHLACIAVIWVGISPVAVAVCLLMYWVRMFAITAFYHRYFSHRSFKTNRFWQFCFAILGNSASQRGPLWWAAHHRKHHKHSDEDEDLHSPVKHGFWWSHVGWFTCDAAFKTDYSVVKDWAKFPELKFLNRYDSLVPVLMAVCMFALGVVLNALWPNLGTSGWQMLIWGYFISTVLLFHGTFTINSLCHQWGKRRFETRDDSRNNFWLALITLGEGWHNNHHRFATSARQGFYWWEIDISYYILKAMSKLGIIYDLTPVPEKILREGREKGK